MSRRLVLAPDAEQDLDTIFDYLVQNNPAAAAHYIRARQEQCVFYAEFPFIGQAEPDIAQRLNLPREHVRSCLRPWRRVRHITRASTRHLHTAGVDTAGKARWKR